MSEMRLICPGCEAEYRLPPDAIPASGREVECSACGHVWTAKRADAAPARLDLGDFAAEVPAPGPALPPPSSRLPADVLDILRQEVEHERRLREGDGGAMLPAVRTPPPEDDADWPATTITATTGADPNPPTLRSTAPEAPAPRPAPTGRADPQPPRAETPRLITRPLSVPVSQPEPQPARPAPQVIRHDPPPAPRRKARGGAYRAGFGLSMMIAASCVALYLLAPGLAASDSPFGDRLMELRHEVDRGRLWLQVQARDLTG